ncbi:Transcription-repair coupling factor [hydrothermal vent metagenome]|uniref:Transcription-repair coupling factor n=1 Tax=hydrothermal vent metagenome TaxID=652676 RepID=A0A3B1BPB1_9ZZZZ
MISLYGLESVVEGAVTGGRPVSCSGVTKSAKGLVISTLSMRTKRPVVVVCDKAAKAEEIAETLRFFLPDGSLPLLYYPPWEILPYEEMSPHPDVSGQRLSTLTELSHCSERFILVTTVEALSMRTLPQKTLRNSVTRIDVGDSIDLDILADHLVAHGYDRVDLVEERGEFSIRGGIVDVFTGEGERPRRIELFGDEVESIRLYNPETQRSLERVERVSLIPFREVFYEGLDNQTLLERFDTFRREGVVGIDKAQAVEESLRSREFFSGMERLFHIFYPESATLFDYLPESAAFILDEPESIFAHMKSFYSLVESARRDASDNGGISPEPESLYLSETELERAIGDRELLRLRELSISEEEEETFIISTSAPERYRGKVASFIENLNKMLADGFSVILVASSTGGAERLKRALAEHDIGATPLSEEEMAAMLKRLCDRQPALFEGNLFITVGRLSEGMIIRSDKWAIYTDDEIFGKTTKAVHRTRKGRRAFSIGVAELEKGDLIVHSTHGVGRYVGAREMSIADLAGEYLELEYAERQRLYLPITSIGMLKKYSSGGGSTPALDRMGGVTWKKTKSKVKKSLLAMADKLVKLQAMREISKGHAFSPKTNFHSEFADTFEFEETEDQRAAIEDVASDMEKERAMDRLICGDVGYGKTEVAMRAAFNSVYDGKQVAVLTPTTLLTQQHYQTFAERFRSFPVRVEALSRFKTKKEQKETIGAAIEGKIDILIGTHRLLQKDVNFKNLGLVIIDEEQRFGVKHKEKLKNLSKNVDLLTLTATPIPRTLHTSMVGIRDLSVIETPPQDRLAVRNFTVKFSDKTIREAILREMDRGGQVFFVHNQVKSIHSLAKYLNKIAPEARISVAHGQMHESELESVMTEFVEKRCDILVCTTIIESGLDIPSANTIIINRADRFGLAQLYQLRGRVGRDRHRAYCYFLVPALSGMTEVAKQRLKAIEDLSDLGSGFKLAARDMEIRGAGNLLGAQQSGQIDAVGFDTYCDMLEDAVRELKGEPPSDRFEVNMNLSYQGRISQDYVPGLNQRIDLYNRLAGVSTLPELESLWDEMKDRFGPIPEETEKLLLTTRVRLLCKDLRIEKVDMIRDKLYIVIHPSTKLDAGRLASAADKYDQRFKFTSESGAEFIIEGYGWRERLDSISGFLTTMQKSVV